MARIVAQATSELEPELVMMAPVDAIRKLLRKASWSLGDVDLIELNEAFSVQAVAITKELGFGSGASECQRRRRRVGPR